MGEELDQKLNERPRTQICRVVSFSPVFQTCVDEGAHFTFWKMLLVFVVQMTNWLLSGLSGSATDVTVPVSPPRVQPAVCVWYSAEHGVAHLVGRLFVAQNEHCARECLYGRTTRSNKETAKGLNIIKNWIVGLFLGVRLLVRLDFTF